MLPSTSRLAARRLARPSAACFSSVSGDTPYYDVVVAGGGVVGFSTAYHLATASNLKVAVVERDRSYKHASAMLSAGGIRHQFSERANIELSMYGSEFLKSIGVNMRSKDCDEIDIQFCEGGYMFLASEKGVETLRKNYEVQKSTGADVVMMDPEQLVRRFPWINAEGVEAAVLGIKDQGWFDPWAYLCAMRAKCVDLGVHVLDGEVKHFDLGAKNSIEKVHIERKDKDGNATFGTVATGRVVNAAGAWASKLLEACGSYDYPIRPRKRSVFAYHCAAEETWKGDAASPLVVDPNGVYFRREGNGGRFLCGVSPPEDQDPDGQSVEELSSPDHEHFEDIIWPTIAHRVKHFEAIKVISSWAGFYDYNTFDQNAIIGIHPDVPNMYLANGFSGHGLQQSPGTGRAVSELILHGEYKTVDCSVFGFERVRKNEPFFEQGIV